jgi:hypothetical protein
MSKATSMVIRNSRRKIPAGQYKLVMNEPIFVEFEVKCTFHHNNYS